MKFLLFALIAVVAAEPEADSFLPYYRTPYTAGLYSPYRYSGLTTGLYSPYRSAYYGIYKREAEAESDPELVYTNGKFNTNLRNLAKGVHTQYAGGHGAIYDSVFPHSRNVYSGYSYPYTAAAGLPYAQAVHPYRSAYYGIYKREAEAESDSESYFPYSSIYRTPYAAAGLYQPYRSLAYSTAFPTATYPYRSAYYGIYKREAEAESDSDSESYYPYTSVYRTPYTAGIYNPAAYSPFASSIYRSPYVSSLYRPYGF